MSRISVLFLITFFLSGCATTLKKAGPAPVLRYVSFSAPDLLLTSSTSYFSDETLKRQVSERYVAATGDQLLRQILIGYGDQTEAFRYTSEQDENVRFEIQKVTVSKALITLNLPHPGPVYKIRMHVDVWEDGLPVQSVVLKQRVNVAEINFPEERFKWMTPEEKADSGYQERAFRAAIRRLYQQLYFTYFDIKLQL